MWTGRGVGKLEAVTARERGLMPVVEPEEEGRDTSASNGSTTDFLVFAIGRAGKGPEGGGATGGGGLERGRCGIAEAILAGIDSFRRVGYTADGRSCSFPLSPANSREW